VSQRLRKPRPNSLDQLTRDQQQQLEHWLFGAPGVWPLTYPEAVGRVHREWGFVVSISALARFYRRCDEWRRADALRARQIHAALPGHLRRRVAFQPR
jgi:hypothetical protein